MIISKDICGKRKAATVARGAMSASLSHLGMAMGPPAVQGHAPF